MDTFIHVRLRCIGSAEDSIFFAMRRNVRPGVSVSVKAIILESLCARDRFSEFGERYRPAHLAKLSDIMMDPLSTQNDRFVRHQLKAAQVKRRRSL